MITLEKLKELEKKNELKGLQDLSPELYHNRLCPGISKSHLQEILKSPEHYQEWLKNPKTSPAMEFGSACHTAVLEPELFKERFAHYPNTPEFEGRSKAAIQARLEFDQAHSGKTILDLEDFQRIGCILESVYSDDNASKLLKGLKEKSFFWTDQKTGILCKARPDVLNVENLVMTDFKTISDSSLETFERSVANYGYYIQAAFYSEGVNQYLQKEIQDFVFVCVESKAPYKVKIRRLSDQAIELGKLHYEDALAKYKHYSSSNLWKEASTIEEASLPSWFFARTSPGGF